MEGETGTGTIAAMPPSTHSGRDQRSGEYSIIREAVNAAVKEAMKAALDEDSGIMRGADCGTAHCENIRKITSEIKSSMTSMVGDMRQDLLNRINENNNDLRTMVKTEVDALRAQVVQIQASLHQGDTQLAVLDTKLDTIQAEIDRVRDRDASTAIIAAHTPRREISTDRHRKSDGGGEKPISKSPITNTILVAVLSAVGTAFTMWGLDLLGRGARDQIKEITTEERAKAHQQKPPVANVSAPASPTAAP